MPIENDDFVSEPASYVRRVVAFFDILGWRNKIEWANDDIDRITLLKNIVRLFAIKGAATGDHFDFRMTSFSDNVVVSAEVNDHTLLSILMRLAITQLGAAQLGFLIRGGVTIGNIVHDEHVVFGPGMNRAYHLESKVANNPRIILDHMCLSEFGDLSRFGDLLKVDGDGFNFINSWSKNVSIFSAIVKSKGQSQPLIRFPDELVAVLQFLGSELKGPATDCEKERVKWLYRIIFSEMGYEAKNLDEVLAQISAATTHKPL